MSYDMLQGLLTKFAAAAGLKKHYTTHCFRRGGVQYRFMYAPIGMRWPLSWIRWWGGWAIGEHSFEAGHGNTLHPIPIGADQSFMGDHIAVAPVSGQEVQEFKGGIDHKIDELVKVITATLSHTCHSDTVTRTLETTVDPSNPSIGPMHVSHTQSRAISRAASALVIKQWEEIDPVTKCALKDWYEGSSATASKRNQRKTIFDKFVRRVFKALITLLTLKGFVLFIFRLGRNEAEFLSKYPDAGKSIPKLLEAIRWNKGTTRSSKYGTAQERKSNSPRSSPDPEN
ncbi:uncharacterized protein LACBIDRAFT_331984 [Laccaria bicolor S238N-H82]|uniref:Predicted protein n=1 Tax=Laccaria bicolor (strain S238N-H82 / ATCC MYA-4686) TaxID=486041 RepID=B0DQX3_LACBS|nr:uncharacterized protein LACBIDRAFT_331984 [Laccaria bicolor S238N-H82]EDR02962.1 predicted protein [Laccaria bicolor S238N-H82]|eukprot:XP_001886385.1 predicted protein [Laccaria bicolor S238N-H82]